MNDTLSNGLGGWWLIVRHIPMCNAAESTSWGPPRVGDRMFLLAKDITFENLTVPGYREDVMFARSRDILAYSTTITVVL